MYLAELNIAKLHRPLDHDENAEFVASLAAVNLLAESSKGFVWRLKDADGNSSSYVDVYDDPLLIVNLSVWASMEDLRHFVYRSGHAQYLRRKREWFAPPEPADIDMMVCWWVPENETPDPKDAARRLELLRSEGPCLEGFRFTEPIEPV
jgi:heme-degrading monooxygenase HmoA